MEARKGGPFSVGPYAMTESSRRVVAAVIGLFGVVAALLALGKGYLLVASMPDELKLLVHGLIAGVAAICLFFLADHVWNRKGEE